MKTIIKDLLLIFIVAAGLSIVQEARACGDDAVYEKAEPTPIIISLSTL
jgi:hypothetical protein